MDKGGKVSRGRDADLGGENSRKRKIGEIEER